MNLSKISTTTIMMIYDVSCLSSNCHSTLLDRDKRMYPKKRVEISKNNFTEIYYSLLSFLVTKRVTLVIRRENTRGGYKAKDIKSIVLA